MHILCDKQALIDAVGNVQRGCLRKIHPSRSRRDPPACNGQLPFLAGYDLEMGITTTIEAQVNEPGEIVLTARLFGDIVRRLPGEDVTLSSDDKYNTLIRSGMTEFTIMGISAGEYPELPSVSDGVGLTLPQNLLRSMIRQISCRRPDRCPAGSYRCPV